MEDSGIDSDPKTRIGDLLDDNSDSSKSSLGVLDHSATQQLQRRLEKKLQDGKRSSQQQGEYKKVNTGQNLIPIQRLPIPSKGTAVKEHLPLVEWDSDESEEDIHFFPMNKTNVKSELTDTFSIEEMEVSADEDDLNLLPPKHSSQNIGCCPFSVRCIVL